jgi:hypothetical protein
MVDVPLSSGAGGYKPNTLNSSYMNFSNNTNSITDAQSISYSRDITEANSMHGGASVVKISSPGCFDCGMFTHVPAPPTAMLRRTIDSDQLAASGPRRLDNSLSFSASASHVPVTAQQWNCIAPPPSSSAVPDGTQNASTFYTNVPSNGVLLRMVDSTGNSLWCLQSDYNSGTTTTTTAPPPPPPPPQPQPTATITSPLQISVLESPPSSLPMQAPATTAAITSPFRVSPLNGALPLASSATGAGGAALHDAQPGCGTSSPSAEGDTDDYEYEPYNSNTLANRRVGSLDRVRCKLHGKERSAQNMVMMRNKATNEIHWRCKRSSQCKVRTIDSDDTPLSSKESTLRSNAAEALMLPTSDNGLSNTLNNLNNSINGGSQWSRQPPAPPQYTLVSPPNGALPLDGSFHAMSQTISAYPSEYVQPAAHLVTLPSAFSQGQPYTPSATYYPVLTQESTPQLSLPSSPPQQQHQQQQGHFVTVNGVQYQIVQVDTPARPLP